MKTSSETLEGLKKEAREQFGTDDLDALRTKLEEMTQENERKRAEYQQHLTEIETQLKNVEASHHQSLTKEAKA